MHWGNNTLIVVVVVVTHSCKLVTYDHHDYMLNYNWGNQTWLKQPWYFYGIATLFSACISSSQMGNKESLPYGLHTYTITTR